MLVKQRVFLSKVREAKRVSMAEGGRWPVVVMGPRVEADGPVPVVEEVGASEEVESENGGVELGALSD